MRRQVLANPQREKAASRPRRRIKSPLPGTSQNRMALYELRNVRAALGLADGDAKSLADAPRDTEYQERLANIISRGEEARWRTLLAPEPAAEAGVAGLLARAPHFGALARLVTTHLRSASVIGLPMTLPPILMVGKHGLGKSWFLTKLGALLHPQLPFKKYSMSSASLAEGIDGGHPSWRNAKPGFVANQLLGGQVANPVLFVDELDKASPHLCNGDPYRPFYSLLDPSDARTFGDEYLGFPIDASAVMWIMAANDPELLPAPIVDRLEILVVPEPDEAQRACVAVSIYDEANRARRLFFEEELGKDVIEKLATLSPRMMRRCLDEAMARAAAERRRSLREKDITPPPDQSRKRIGFCR